MTTLHHAASKSLQAAIDEAGGPVRLLRSSNIGPFVFPVVPSEFTNWRNEQRAARESCLMAEQSYHMTELHLRGVGVIPFIAKLAVNRFEPFPVNRAKQLVLAGHDGNLVSDAILFREEQEFFRIVGAPFASDWVQYNADKMGKGIEVTRDDNYVARHGKGARDVFRVQILGPNALELMREVTDRTLPEIAFFNVGEFQIAGHTVRALRHGMADASGFEIYGHWDAQQSVREALERVGEKYGLRKGGGLTYASNNLESGWMGIPVPAIYHSKEMRSYREWLPSHFLEGLASLGGSFVSDNINDYYMDPVELGYRNLIDFNRDFIGREALQRKAQEQKRKKVTLIWNEDDVADLLRSSLFPHGRGGGKFFSLPSALYATFQCDAVLSGSQRIGVSQAVGYSANVAAVLSLSLVDIEHAEPGTEVTVLWGEPNSRRSIVEPHEVREIRAKVAPSPYHKVPAK